MPFKCTPILAEKPIITAFDKLNTQEINTIILFALAFSNRMLFKSAVHIRKDLQLPKPLNTLNVRYLLLLYCTCAAKQEGRREAVTFLVLERNDYYKRDKKRLNNMHLLSELGLISHSKTLKGTNKYSITDKGIKAIDTVLTIIQETIHCQPRSNYAHHAKKRITTLS